MSIVTDTLLYGGLILCTAGALILLALGLAARSDKRANDFWSNYDD